MMMMIEMMHVCRQFGGATGYAGKPCYTANAWLLPPSLLSSMLQLSAYRSAHVSATYTYVYLECLSHPQSCMQGSRLHRI